MLKRRLQIASALRAGLLSPAERALDENNGSAILFHARESLIFQYRFSINRDQMMLLTTMPPRSMVSFQLTPKSCRLIEVLATKPVRVLGLCRRRLPTRAFAIARRDWRPRMVRCRHV